MVSLAMIVLNRTMSSEPSCSDRLAKCLSVASWPALSIDREALDLDLRHGRNDMDSRLLCQSLTGEEENRETRDVLAESHLGWFVGVRF